MCGETAGPSLRFRPSDLETSSPWNTTLRDPFLFRQGQPTRALAEMVRDLEGIYLQLASKATAGWSYDEVKSEVQSFFVHPGLAELCRLATLRATRRLAGAREVWLDVFQGALVQLLGKVHRAFHSVPEEGATLARKLPLLGFLGRPRGRGGFAGWLYSVLFNACTDEFRKLSRYRRRFVADPLALEMAPAREQEREILEIAAPLETVLGFIKMDYEVRQVLLGFLAGKSGRRIAEENNRTSAWVTRKKRKGLALLRKHFHQ
jgi:hypothetical protein